MELIRNPDDEILYMCGGCKRSNCKLWREYSTFLDHNTLLCIECMGKKNGKSYNVNREGQILYCGTRTDQIDWRVPAVPTDDNKTFWGYTSIPNEGISWWTKLSN